MKQLYMLFLCLTIGMTAFAQTMRLVAIGSSTTAGTGAWPFDSSWVNRFNQYYNHQLGMVDTVHNLGVGGYNCYKGMPTSYTCPSNRPGTDNGKNVTKAIQLLQGLATPENGVVIVNYPTNEYYYYTIAEIMFCLQTIYDSVTIHGHRCIITTTQPRTDGSFNNSATKKKLADIKDSIINRFGVANTLNFWDGMFNPADTTILPAFSAGDNIHYNNAGHRELYQRVVAKNIFTAATLPIKISSFTARMQNEVVNIQWQAQCDNPNALLFIERSSNGKDFQNLCGIPAKAPHTLQVYTYTDKEPLSGNNYYRLAIKEGSEWQYSIIAAIHNKATAFTITRLSPVPAITNNLQVELHAIRPQTVQIRIIAAAGNAVYHSKQNITRGHNKFNIPVATLAAGVYILEASTATGQKTTQTFTK